MAGRYEPRSIGAGIWERLAALHQQQEAEKRAATLDGIATDDRQRLIARQDAADRRQAAIDAQEAADRQAKDAQAANTAAVRGKIAEVTSSPDFLTDPTKRRFAASLYESAGLPIPSYLEDVMKPGAAPKRTTVKTVDANGKPITKAVSDDELTAGVPDYVAPKEPRAPSYSWVTRGGQPVRVREEDIRPGDRPYAADGNDKPAQYQSAADAFYSRAKDASDVLEDVEGSVSQFNKYIPSFMQSEAGQAYAQAKRQFTESYLRKDSGAAISDSEYANADRTYFVQPGDSAATVTRKRAARRKILDSLQQQGSGKGNNNNSGGNAGGNTTHKPTAAELIRKYGG